MSDDFGACVVLIPEPNELPDTVEGGQHITLAYFGDTPLSETNFQDLLKIVLSLPDYIQDVPLSVMTDEDTFFGEDEDAHVLTLDDSNESLPVILRTVLLEQLTPQLKLIFEKAETFPTYRPHMTLGYESDGATEVDDDDIPDFLQIKGVAVWNGEQRIEFPLNRTLAHIGTPRHSGRYPWGSGQNPNQRHKSFLDYVDNLKREGMSEVDIAKGLGMTTTQLRNQKTLAIAAKRQHDQDRAVKLKETGMSNVAIGAEMGIPESSVRALLNPVNQHKAKVLDSTADMIKNNVAEKGMIDVGVGSNFAVGISETKLKAAVAKLQDEGYKLHYVKVNQLGTDKQTTLKVLTKDDVPYRDVFLNRDKIQTLGNHSDDGGLTFDSGVKPPKSFDSKRISVRYGDEGGSSMDGVIELRRGVDDLSMGASRYAQVRIAVDGTHYLKGMAMYADDLPDGVDIRFNTNKLKADAPTKLDVMKKMKTREDGSIDDENPFGAVIKPGGQKGALNIVNEEGDWGKWSKNLSSQALSKQSPALAKQQLDVKFKTKQDEYDEIMRLTNPVVKKKLLESFADDADSSSIHLKAAALPRQSTHVILPLTKIKENEIYAPNYHDGEKVVLIRHPHGGIFEIPELTVNNKNSQAKSVIDRAVDAVGIHPKVAERLSGADFDGDTVLVIPNNSRKIKTKPALEGLKDFDPKTAYPAYEGMPKMSSRTKQLKMGDVSNLITDMTIKRASDSEIAAAVRHSMVVIDAEKHNLDYRQSYIDNGIGALKAKYQGRAGKAGTARSGASTLISQASSEQRVRERVDRAAKDGGRIDKATGEKRYTETGASYVNADGKTVFRTTKSTRMAEAKDARSLSSGTLMEEVYADHANKLKAIANEARRVSVNTKPTPYSPSAKATYAKEVSTLQSKLNVALQNKPRERQAQLLANTIVDAKKKANPDMDNSDLKKIKGQALQQARNRVGAKKTSIDITPSEWNAIQAGAVSTNFLNQILQNTDTTLIKTLATPRENTVMTESKMALARARLASGATQAEVAASLGVPVTTLNTALGRE